MSSYKNIHKRLIQLVILWLTVAAEVTWSDTPTFTFYALDARPAGYKDGEQVAGFYADILRRVREELGLKNARLILAPYARILHSLNENNSGFVLTCLFSNREFASHVHQPQPIARFKTGVVSTSSAPFTWKNHRGKRVATIRGASRVYGKKLHNEVENGDLELVSVTDYTEAVRMLKGGRIDGFAGNLSLMLYQTKTANVAFAKPAIIDQKVSKITISVAPNTVDGDEVVTRVANIIAKMRKQGEINTIIDRYLPASARQWYE